MHQLISTPHSLTLAFSIARNATTSPLLKLPTEIREQIWTEVLGNNLIHLKYLYEDDDLYDDDVDFETNESLHNSLQYSRRHGKTYGSAWRHLICEEDCKEDKPAEDRVSPKTGRAYRWHPHRFCDPHYETPNPYKQPLQFYSNHETMRLTVLRVSNQTYAEATRVLWSSNTFSFPDGVTAKRFLMTRTMNQKRLIRSLRFEMQWWLEQYYKEWNSALTMPVVRSLSGLRNLRVLITHDMEAELYEDSKNDLLDTTSWCEGLRKLSTLPLTNVEVLVKSAGLLKRKRMWTDSDMKEVAAGLQEMLLNPQGADVYAEQQIRLQEVMKRCREMEKERAAMRRPLPRN